MKSEQDNNTWSKTYAAAQPLSYRIHILHNDL